MLTISFDRLYRPHAVAQKAGPEQAGRFRCVMLDLERRCLVATSGFIMSVIPCAIYGDTAWAEAAQMPTMIPWPVFDAALRFVQKNALNASLFIRTSASGEGFEAGAEGVNRMGLHETLTITPPMVKPLGWRPLADAVMRAADSNAAIAGHLYNPDQLLLLARAMAVPKGAALKVTAGPATLANGSWASLVTHTSPHSAGKGVADSRPAYGIISPVRHDEARILAAINEVKALLGPEPVADAAQA